MTPLLAANPLDNPLVLAAIVIGGMIVNWLAQRRKAQQENQPAPERHELPTPSQPPDKFNLEETLRELMGEEAAPRQPAPPPIVQPAERSQPQPESAQFPSETPPTVAPKRAGVASFAIPQTPEEAALRFEQLSEQGRNPAKAQDLRRCHRPGSSARAALWSNREKVRQAFVASLVFGPPKGLENPDGPVC